MKLAVLLAVAALAVPTVPPDDDGDTIPDSPEPTTPYPPTPTPTLTPEATPTVVLEPTSTATAVPSATPTATPTVETPTVTPTPSLEPTAVPTDSPTATPVPGTIDTPEVTPAPITTRTRSARRTHRHRDRKRSRSGLGAQRTGRASGSDPATSPPQRGPASVDQPRATGSQSGRPYVIVIRGECLSLIAERYGRDWRVLAQLNHLADPDLIYPGQRILL